MTPTLTKEDFARSYSLRNDAPYAVAEAGRDQQNFERDESRIAVSSLELELME